jgi:hypothetical protein
MPQDASSSVSCCCFLFADMKAGLGYRSAAIALTRDAKVVTAMRWAGMRTKDISAIRQAAASNHLTGFSAAYATLACMVRAGG